MTGAVRADAEPMPARLKAMGSQGLAASVAALAVVYGAAVIARLAAIAGVAFPINEGSAYYVAVAGNLVEGRGLVTDALWSFATPPLLVPRPAFELWQPMASFISAAAMSVLGGGFASAQLGYALIGALAAPLSWAVAREAAQALRLPPGRARTVALGSGLVAAILGPFLTATAIPDSTMPFLLLGLASCLLMPRALEGGRVGGVALGVALGLAYLSRLEAVYIGLAFLLLVGRRWRLLAPVVVGGLVVAVPWLMRNLLAFGTLFPGQALENVFFTRNEDVFAYLDRPSAGAFVDQGAAVLVGNVLAGLSHNLVSVLLVPAAPVVIAGALGAAWLARRRAVRPTALAGLLLSGGLTLAAVSLLFPVATLWGTFEHAAGPLLAGLVVAAVIGADALVARVREFRRWPRSNAWLAPLALVALTLPISVAMVTALPGLAAERASRVNGLAAALARQPDLAPRLISDHPVWLSEATGWPAIALPDEPLDAVLQLATDLGAPMIAILDGRGRYPAALRTAEGGVCFEERELDAMAPAGSALFVVRPGCRP